MTAAVKTQPGAILDGLVRVYSTCRACNLVMQVTDARQTVHPMCPEQRTQMENWQETWRALAESALDGDVPPALQRKMDALEAKMENAAAERQKTALAISAMQYASLGWPVFPLAKNSKQPAIPKSKGGNGFKDATTDVERICAWWKRHPDHNIGLATGHAFDVIDIDPGAGGAQSLSELLHDNRIPIVHGIVATAGSEATATEAFRPSGLHLYVKATGKGNFAALRPGVDYRGRGGFVVAPPSTRGSRVRSWSWSVMPSPEIKR
jgi:hypothetical protein